MASIPLEFTSLMTKFGEIIGIWQIVNSQPRILRIFLSNLESSDPLHQSASSARQYYFPTAIPGIHPLITRIMDNIQTLLQGTPVDFSLDLLNFEGCWGKQVPLIRMEARVPRGHITTYSQLALACDIPRGARVAARALSQNPFPLIIPCHRAVRNDGDLGGYQGGLAMKQVLLEFEGINCWVVKNIPPKNISYRIDNWLQLSQSPLFERFGNIE
jgi:methylated-DNA-[protein]-cysteine S-methyltransferase